MGTLNRRTYLPPPRKPKRLRCPAYKAWGASVVHRHKKSPLIKCNRCHGGSLADGPRDGHNYTDRSINLVLIGFSSYAKYIKSALWAGIRFRVLAAMESKCHGCSRDASEVHHRKYGIEQLKGTDVRDLVPICRDCHQSIEFDGKTKRTLEQANLALNEIRFARNREEWLST